MTTMSGRSEAVRAQPVASFLAVAAGALLVSIGAQVAVPIPGTPVPITMQVPAVLMVGGLLGARLGAISLVLYLIMGALGLPVFAAGGVPGVARLFGPTGGYLLAYPLAAALTGFLAGRRSIAAVALAVVTGTAIIHAGGVAQLSIIAGSLESAVDLGSVPFLLGDILKMTLAGLIIGRFGSRVRGLLI